MIIKSLQGDFAESSPGEVERFKKGGENTQRQEVKYETTKLKTQTVTAKEESLWLNIHLSFITIVTWYTDCWKMRSVLDKVECVV